VFIHNKSVSYHALKYNYNILYLIVSCTFYEDLFLYLNNRGNVPLRAYLIVIFVYAARVVVSYTTALYRRSNLRKINNKNNNNNNNCCKFGYCSSLLSASRPELSFVGRLRHTAVGAGWRVDVDGIIMVGRYV